MINSMVRLLAVVAILVTILGAVVLFNYLKPKNAPVPIFSSTNSSSDSSSLTDRVGSLEEAVTLLDEKVAKNSNQTPSNSTSSSSDISDLDSRVSKLETEFTDLESRLGSSSPAPVSQKQSTLYIPLGWTGSSSALDWTSLSSQSIAISGSDYPGYTSMQFEANISVYQGNGQAFARILDQDDGTVVTSSQISTSSQDFTWVSSQSFTLPSSSKTYVLELKTPTGYAAQIQNARIKINF